MSETNSKFATGSDAPYWAALAKGELHMPRCHGCQQWHWPAVSRCSACSSEQIDWLPVEFSGTVYSWIRTWTKFQGTEGLPSPFVSVLVELPQAGGRRLLGILEGDDSNIAIGDSVRGHVGVTVFNGEDVPALRWRITGSQEAAK